MSIDASVKTVFERDGFGRFREECARAAERTVDKTVRAGARMSRQLAPAGGERKSNYSQRPGYVPLKRSIKTETGGTRGSWFTIAPHWKFVEFSTAPHLIYGKMMFPWQDGYFVWNDPKFGPMDSIQGPSSAIGGGYKNWNSGGAYVWHPGTRAQAFMQPAYEAVVKRQMMEIAKREYPG